MAVDNSGDIRVIVESIHQTGIGIVDDDNRVGAFKSNVRHESV